MWLKQGYFLSANELPELAAIKARLAYFASVIFEVAVDAENLNRIIVEPTGLVLVVYGFSPKS